MIRMRRTLSKKVSRISWQAWAELLRLPNLFTVPGDILVGWCLTGMRGGFPFLTIAASLCFYSAGLLLNDFCDAKVDAHERPNRPIPSGRVSRWSVLGVSILLMFGGLLLAGVWNLAALALIALICFYDLIAKHIPWVGVITMGCCRGMNLYLGATGAWPIESAPLSPQLITAVLFFTLYIVLISIIAKNEADPRAKVKTHRFLAPVMTMLLVPLFFWFGRGNAWGPLLVAPYMLIFVMRTRQIPQLVAGLIRFLILLQLLWCTAMYSINMTIVGLFLSLALAATLLSRHYAGS